MLSIPISIKRQAPEGRWELLRISFRLDWSTLVGTTYRSTGPEVILLFRIARRWERKLKHRERAWSRGNSFHLYYCARFSISFFSWAKKWLISTWHVYRLGMHLTYGEAKGLYLVWLGKRCPELVNLFLTSMVETNFPIVVNPRPRSSFSSWRLVISISLVTRERRIIQ